MDKLMDSRVIMKQDLTFIYIYVCVCINVYIKYVVGVSPTLFSPSSFLSERAAAHVSL